jgi:chemotaxis protein CheX
MAVLARRAEQIARLERDLDRAADEVFSTMMGIGCAPSEISPASEREMISAVIGLAGVMSGCLVLQCGLQAAMGIADRLTGIESPELDAIVRDAVGEVANMVAGAWKGFDPILSSGCLLSTPTVISGTSYELFSQHAPIRIERSYRFAGRSLTITVYCDLLS